ncbi:MAG: hypothetical protein ACRCU6_03525 [Fusobacteriaceae bacterium]
MMDLFQRLNLKKIEDIVPIVCFSKKVQLKKPEKIMVNGKERLDFSVSRDDFLDPVTTIKDFKRLIEDNRYFVTGQNKVNSANGNTYNSFYLDLDENIKTTLEESREQINSLTGYYPFCSWYSQSCTPENLKQKHLFVLDVNLHGGKDEGMDFEIFKNAVANFSKKCGFQEIDHTAITPARITFAKKADTEALFSDKDYVVSLEEFFKPVETKTDDIISTGKITVNLFEAVCKKNIDKTKGDHLYSYYNLRNLMWFLIHLKEFDEEAKENVFKPWIKSLGKDSEEAIFYQIDRDINKIPFEEKETLKESSKKTLEKSIFDIVADIINNEEFHEDINIKRIVLETLDKYDLFMKYENGEIEKLVRKLQNVSELKSHKESLKYSEDVPMQLNLNIVRNRNTTKKFEGSPTFKNILSFEFQPGVTVISAPSHSGKTYLTLGLAILGKLPTIYYALDQSADGFLQYVERMTQILKTNEIEHISYISKLGENSFKTIKNNIESTGAKVVIFDMLDQLAVQDGKTEYETQLIQIKLMRKLREVFPDVCFLLVGGTAKGKKGEVTLENAIAGHRGFGYTVDATFSIARDDEKKTVKIVCTKDRYSSTERGNRFGLETEEKKQITDFFK